MNENFAAIVELFPLITLIVVVSVGGWVFTTWLRIKNGYPIETSWGESVHPQTDRETAERVKLLTSENAQLRAELGSVKNRLEQRLAVLERIITDRGLETAEQIEALRQLSTRSDEGRAD